MTAWRLACLTCKAAYPSVVISSFEFDHEGNLFFHGICRLCLHRNKTQHSAEEIAADVIRARQEWLKEHPEEMDFAEWEEEMEE